MDRYGWLKFTTQSSNVYDASPVNNQIIFFDGHGSHFDDGALRQIMCKNIQTFLIKAGNSTNDQPDDYGQNAKLKSLYNVAKIKWLLKYGMKGFSSHHMSSALVEAWDSFKV